LFVLFRERLVSYNSSTLLHSPQQVLTCDWSKYNEFEISTGSVDKTIRTFDIRKLDTGPVATLAGHQFAVRRLKYSPHRPATLASASYDMSTVVWNTNPGVEDAIVDRFEHHTEVRSATPCDSAISCYFCSLCCCRRA
jgi:WD40 repeat protein